MATPPRSVLLAACVLATACAVLHRTPATSSRVADGQFVNDFLRLHITVPPGWHVLPPAELAEIEVRARAASKHPDAAGRVSFLVAMTRIDAQGPRSSPAVLALAEKLVIPDLSAGEYANSQVRTNAQCKDDGARDPVVLGAVDGIGSLRHCPGHEERMLSAVVRGYGVLVLGMWHAGEQREDVESVLRTVRFVR